MHAIIFILSVVALSLEAQAEVSDQFAVETSGEFYLPVPKVESFQLTRDQSHPLPNCQELDATILRNIEGIKRCADIASRPESYCKLLIADLRRKILGITNEAFNRRDADASQNWSVESAEPRVEPSHLQGLAQELQILREQIAEPREILTELKGIVIQGSSQSNLKLLSALNASELTAYTLEQNAGQTGIKTASRLVTCELISGRAKVEGSVDTIAKFSVPADVEWMNDLWLVRPRLLAIESLAKSSPVKFFLAGHRLGSFAQEGASFGGEDEVLKAGSYLIDHGSQDFRLIPYANKFQIGRKLPQKALELRHTFKASGSLQ